MRHVVVGDVHGCRAELEALLDELDFDPATDVLVPVGDLVAKGPDARGVVRLCRELGALAVRGNHDEHCLQWLRARESGEPLPELRPTHQRVVDALDEEDWAYLRAQPLHRRFEGLRDGRDDVLVVHAGLVPFLPLDEQKPKWLMNLRSIAASGEPSKRAHDGVPWASRWPGPELVVFGHDAIRGLQKHPNALGLDTGCCYGGHLTAAVFADGGHELVRVPAARQYAPIE
ncbi:MAG: metallophosphoesterase [Deltaproteobacteria bacterium]|nr:metallophosphoesterase [Deltaproteobacteria bacterium]